MQGQASAEKLQKQQQQPQTQAATKNVIRQEVLVEGQLRKLVYQEGQGQCPQKGNQVFALYRGTLETGEQFDSNQDRANPFNFPLGEGRVIKGWDEGFASMKRGQKATLICSPDYAYGKRGSPPRIPANATLNFEVQLLDFKEKKKEKWDLNDEEKVAEAAKLKDNGNQLFKNKSFTQAAGVYTEGIQFVKDVDTQEAKPLLNVLRLNAAQAQLKSNQFTQAIENCSKVIEKDIKNVKALYRRGTGYLQIQEFQKAQTDFQALLSIEPENVDAKKQLQSVKKAAYAFKQKQKKVFGGMFSKGNIYEQTPTPSTQQAKPTADQTKNQETEGSKAQVPQGEPNNQKVYIEQLDANAE